MKREYSIKHVLTSALIAAALTCVVISRLLLRPLGVFSDRYGDVLDYSSLLREIDGLYIGDYEPRDVSDAAMYAAVDALGDRWSYYMTPEEYEDYLDYSTNSYAGIGIGVEIDVETGGMRVLYVYRDSTAEEAGLVAGDVITAIDGADITGTTLDNMKTLLARELGAKAELTVLREDGGEAVIEVEYSYVFTDPVYYEMLDGDIGYVELLNFSAGSSDSFIAAVDDLIESGAQALVFDVRNNGGGRVSELTQILDHLLPEGEVFISVDKDGKETVTTSDASCVELPAAVLVNRYSYSAAEYFAATLGEYGFAHVVGEQTTGKNRSQVTVELPGGGALHISSGQYLTKNRVSLYDTGGLTPEFEARITDEELALLIAGALPMDGDAQLLKAIGLLSDGQ